METKKAPSWGHVVCCFIILIIFILTFGVNVNGLEATTEAASSSSEILPLKTNYASLLVIKESSEEENDIVTVVRTEIDYLVTTYESDIRFLAKVFSVNYEDLIDDLYNRYNEYYDEYGFVETNCGYLFDSNNSLLTYSTVQRGLVEYINDFIDRNPDKVSLRKESYTGSSTYVENMIIYFTKYVYTNVDTDIALSIGAAESGYYKVKYMLSVGNVYGGMSSSGLIHYSNIEYGVLSYVRLLSKNYFGKGLNTIYKIGYVYCPTYDENGYKIASPHWINLVTKARSYYSNKSKDVTAEDLV